MKKPNMMAILLFLTGLLCIASLLFFNHTTYRQIAVTEKDLASAMERITMKQDEIKEAENIYTEAVDKTKANIKRLKQKALTSQQKHTKEHAEIADETETTSVFNETGGEDLFTSDKGHIIALDPGHQSENVDMSAPEPNGPGSSEMKAKCSTGTEGAYTGVAEYQLNLDISLKLRDVLEQRGYQVVMTRTDNETAISNKERAQYAAAQGAEIYVRIHANGDDSSSASGALAISPSQENPYVPHLYEDSNKLSWCILDSYCAVTEFDKLGVYYNDSMTGINWSTIPVTILEMGFMTNENDDRRMNDPSFQQTMVNGIADGIDAYFS